MSDTTRIDLDTKLTKVRNSSAFRRSGRTVQVVGLTLVSRGPSAALGELCHIEMPGGKRRAAEVVGFRDDQILLMPLGELDGIGPGLKVTADGRSLTVPVSQDILGRVLDGLGHPMDGKGPILNTENKSLQCAPPDALRRKRVKDVMPLGVRSVDALITAGHGQRVGIFGGSGVGKSTLLGMFARNAKSDLNVIALIGERGREVRDFIERDLGPEGLARSVVVVVTSDQPALLRIKGALTAATIAEHFRDQGKNVLLMMDSVTRICMAQREIGLAVGEPPTTRGYTPSMFSLLPKLLERSGMGEQGSVTGLYTVLVEGDDMNEPVADACRSILDGHIVLSRDLAGANHFPAIDVLNSQSRVFTDVTTKEHQALASKIRNLMSTYDRARDLLDVGAYVSGSNPDIDMAIKVRPKVQALLKQGTEEISEFVNLIGAMKSIVAAS